MFAQGFLADGACYDFLAGLRTDTFGTQTLDWIISEVAQRGMLIVPVIVNYRCDYGCGFSSYGIREDHCIHQ